VPPTDLIRPCFREPFGEGSRRTLATLTPIARVLDAICEKDTASEVGLPRGFDTYAVVGSPSPHLSDSV
jgi:hypothetical protein